ncbi:MAG TPA: RidA family protein [Dyella sp.]|nr:RidA family protein [Dyella sp.]
MKFFFAVSALMLLTSPTLAADQATQVQHINPATLYAPRGYTHVITVDGGRTVYIAGQTPFDQHGKLVGAGDFSAQAQQTFENLKAALAAGGATFSDVVEMTTYVTDMSHVDAYRKVRNQYMNDPLPTASLIEVKGLFRHDLMIEISAVAVVPATATHKPHANP